MSTQDTQQVREPTGGQFLHTMKLVVEAGLSLPQTSKLHCYLSALLIAVREDQLPPLTEFKMQLRKVTLDLPVLTTGFQGEARTRDEFRQLLKTAKKRGVTIEEGHNTLHAAMDSYPSFLRSQGNWDVVKVTPTQLGIDPWLLDPYQGGLKKETAMKYICRRAKEHGLELFCDEALLRFCMEDKIKGGYSLLAASPHAIGSCMNYQDFVLIRRNGYGKQEIQLAFSREVLRDDTEILFLRPSK